MRAARLRALRRPGRRLGRAGLDRARPPRPRPSRRPLASTIPLPPLRSAERPDRGGARRPRPPEGVPGQGDGLLDRAGDQTADGRLRPHRLARRAVRLDRREVPRLVGLRRPPGELLQPRRAARQRDGLLAERDRRLLGAPLLGELRHRLRRRSRRSPTPTAYVAYPREIFRLSERLARTRFTDLRYYARPERGGHFAALEVPETFLAEVRAGVRALGVRQA